MKEIFREYGSMMLAMLVSVTIVGLLSFGFYHGSKGGQSQGLLEAIGKEAVFDEGDTFSVRDDIVAEMDKADVKLGCQSVLREGKTEKVCELFQAWKEGESVPVQVLQIYNERGEDVLHNGEVFCGGGDICIKHAGRYFVVLKIKTKQHVKKTIPLYVKKGEEKG